VVTDKIVAFTTCNSQEQAAQLARHLIEHRLAACATLLPGAHSFYRWNDEIQNTAEFVVMIKSRRDVFDKLRDAIVQLSSDDIPEVIALPVVDGSEAYLGWLDRELALRDQTL
jgi:periplasmic divalent cation tolerance protein